MLSKGSVLVVDDEINLCRILGAKLAKSGFSVVAVHDGRQAVEKVRETDFDVVLLDLILPKLDGLSALAEIRDFKSDIPVIVMTACESPDAMEKAKLCGVSGYINKPFDLDTLVELVRATSAGAARQIDGRAKGDSLLFSKSRPVTVEIMNGKTSGLYPSAIERKDEDTLSLIAPVRDGSLIDVAVRTPVRVGLAANDAYYSFNSYVLALKFTELPVLVLDKPSVIYRTQRRQSQRKNLAVDVRCARIDDVGEKPHGLSEGVSCDISKHGIRILTREPLSQGDLVYLEAGSDGAVTAVAEVIQSKPQENGSNFEVAMKFREVEGDPLTLDDPDKR